MDGHQVPGRYHWNQPSTAPLRLSKALVAANKRFERQAWSWVPTKKKSSDPRRVYFFHIYMDGSKNKGKTPKMDGENNGSKPY